MTVPRTAPLTIHRIHYLDSVRGLAALAVVVYHFIGWRWEKETAFHLASMIFNGSDAVSLFFVLSGLVLSWKYFHPDESLIITPLHYRGYVLNRLARLYLPFLAALTLYYYSWYHHGDNLQLIIDFFTNKNSWFEEALLVRGKHILYVPGWTLEVEMAGSLFLPFLVLLLRYNRQLFFALLTVTVVLGTGFSMMLHFLLGLLLTYYFPRIAAYDMRQSKLYPFRFVGYLLVFVLFSVHHLDRLSPFPSLLTYWLGILRIDLFQLTGIGAFFMLAYVINSPRLQRFLLGRPLLFLGRISYSLYLLHWFFVQHVMDHWDKFAAPFANSTVAFYVLLAGYVAASLLGATVFNVLVERPATRLGKRLSARFARPAGPTLVPAV